MAVDSGSAGATGSYLGGVTLGQAGLVGNAATFDGTGHAIIGGLNLDADWTLEAIFYADAAGAGPSLGLLGADFTAAVRTAIKAEQWNETGQLGYTVFGVADVTFPDAAAGTPAGYSHVAFVGRSTGVELFVDGVPAGTNATAAVLPRHVIGAGAVRADGTLVDGLVGGIDELAIYDRALAPAELASHVAAIPEPGAAWLLLSAAVSGWLLGRRRRG
jgi:hypothetical protein